MNSEDIKKYEVEADAVWGMSYFDDAYALAEKAKKRGWVAIGSWGKPGYDLGSWPLVMIFFKSQPDKNLFSLVYYVEGDITQYNAPTLEERNAICDYLAWWHWRYAEKSWVKDYPTVESLPDELRGPYRED